MAGPLHDDDRDLDGEDAPMLLSGNPQRQQQEKHHQHRPAPRRGIAWFLCFGLCCFLTLVALTGVLVSGFFADPPKPPQQEPPPQQQQPPSPVSSAPPSTTLPPASPQDQLDLRTGFQISSTPRIRDYVFNITSGPASPDGFNKTGIFINGQSPGPLIEANTGDLLRVTVHNNLPSAGTAIHWHGIDQLQTNHMDGVLGVTQCAIPPGASFTYAFNVSSNRGTFWYHSHSSLQYANGLYGPLVIHSPDERVPAVDDDKLVLFGDLWYPDAEDLLAAYMLPGGDDAGTEPMPDNILVNGRHVSNCTEHGVCAAGSLFRTRVAPGARLRLRLVSHATALPYLFSLDSHTLEIVEIDGVEVRPVATSRVFVNPGQRYSVIVTANQTAGAYRMRASAARGCFHIGNGNDNLDSVSYEGVGVLVYEGVEDGPGFSGTPWDLLARENALFGSEPWTARCRDLPFDLPEPVREMGAYEVGEGNRHVFTFDRETENVTVHTYINETHLYEPLKNDATLWRVMDAFHQQQQPVDTTNATSEAAFGPGQFVMVSQDKDKGAQIVINSDAMMMHPFHLHGQQFQVVGWGRGVFGEEDVVTTWNLDNPMRRDTITIGGYSHVVLRIPGTNPGVWALHCHILWHAEEGMFVQIGQRLDELAKLIAGVDAGDGEKFTRRFCKAGVKAGAQ